MGDEKDGICGAGRPWRCGVGQQGAPAAPSSGPASAARNLGKFRQPRARRPRGPGRDTADLAAARPSPAVGSLQHPLPAAPPGPCIHSSPSAQQGCSDPQGGPCSLGPPLQWGVFIARGEAWPLQHRPICIAVGRSPALPERLERPREREESCRAPVVPFSLDNACRKRRGKSRSPEASR